MLSLSTNIASDASLCSAYHNQANHRFEISCSSSTLNSATCFVDSESNSCNGGMSYERGLIVIRTDGIDACIIKMHVWRMISSYFQPIRFFSSIPSLISMAHTRFSSSQAELIIRFVSVEVCFTDNHRHSICM